MKNYRMQSLVLVLIAFALGFSEFIIVGVLPDIAKTFHEPVTIVGLLVTIFALVYAISTPLITMLIGTRSLLKVELALWIVFILGNAMVMAAPSYPILVAARVITAVVSGVIISIATTFANSLAPLEKKGRADCLDLFWFFNCLSLWRSSGYLDLNALWLADHVWGDRFRQSGYFVSDAGQSAD